MGKRSITSQKVFDECTEEWRLLAEVVNIAMPTVPPGKALRFFESRSMRLDGSVKPEWSEDEKIRSGQRHYVMQAARTLTNSHQIELRTTPEGDQFVRLAPARPAFVPLDTCPHCLRPYDLLEEDGELLHTEEAMPPFRTGAVRRPKVIYPPQFNRRRFG